MSPFSFIRRTMVLTVLLAQPALSFRAWTSSIKVLGPAQRHSITRHSLGERALRLSSISSAPFLWLVDCCKQIGLRLSTYLKIPENGFLDFG